VQVAPALFTSSIVIGKQVNVRRYVTGGLNREIVVTIQRVLNVVEKPLRAGECIRNQDFSKFNW
jgi:hypothetical protein